MVEIGGRPILWHIMKIYSAQGVNDFVVCLGYRGYVIKEYFATCIRLILGYSWILHTGSDGHSRPDIIFNDFVMVAYRKLKRLEWLIANLS
jgi:NDP-sugar pyrophosphorylase family protein